MANPCDGRNSQIIQAVIYECTVFEYCGDLCEGGGGPLPPADMACQIAQYDGTAWVATRPAGITEVTVGPTTGFYSTIALALASNCRFIRVVDTYTDTSTWSLPALGLTSAMIYVDPGVVLTLGAPTGSLDISGAAFVLRGSGVGSSIVQATPGGGSPFLSDGSTFFDILDLRVTVGSPFLTTLVGRFFARDCFFFLPDSPAGVVTPVSNIYAFHECNFQGTGTSCVALRAGAGHQVIMSNCSIEGTYSTGTASGTIALELPGVDTQVKGLTYNLRPVGLVTFSLAGQIDGVKQFGSVVAGTLSLVLAADGMQVSNVFVEELVIGVDEVNVVNVNTVHLGVAGVRTILTNSSTLTNFFVTGTDAYIFSLSRCQLSNFVFDADTGLTFITNGGFQPQNSLKGIKSANTISFGDTTGTGWFGHYMECLNPGGTGGMRAIIFETLAANNLISNVNCFEIIFRNTAGGLDPTGNKFVNVGCGTVFSEATTSWPTQPGLRWDNCVIGALDQTGSAINRWTFTGCRLGPSPIDFMGTSILATNCTFNTTLTVSGSNVNISNSFIDSSGGLVLTGSASKITGLDIPFAGANTVTGIGNQVENCEFTGPVTTGGTDLQVNNCRFLGSVTFPGALTTSTWTGNCFALPGGAGVVGLAGSAPLMVGNRNLAGAAGYSASLANAVGEGIAPTNV